MNWVHNTPQYVLETTFFSLFSLQISIFNELYSESFMHLYTFLHSFINGNMKTWLWTHKLKPHVRFLLCTESVYGAKLPLYAHKIVIYCIRNGFLLIFHLRSIVNTEHIVHSLFVLSLACLLKNAMATAVFVTYFDKINKWSTFSPYEIHVYRHHIIYFFINIYYAAFNHT